jgi:hypothetical protein
VRKGGGSLFKHPDEKKIPECTIVMYLLGTKLGFSIGIKGATPPIRPDSDTKNPLVSGGEN